MKVVSLLTGRGNNTLKDKNIRLVNGKPLLYYPAIAGIKSKYVFDSFVSSDDVNILDIAAKVGYKKIIRPTELAAPDSKHVDTLLHALKIMKHDYDLCPDILLVLLANCATVKTSWIDDCIEKMHDNDEITAVVPVLREMDHHPFRAKKVSRNGYLEAYFDFDSSISSNRQDLPINYFLCHNFWVLNVKKSLALLDGEAPWTFMGKNVLPYEVGESFDVHNEDDLLKTEKWLLSNT